MDEKNDLQSQVKSSTGLEDNIAGLLCYLGTFVTGIIFYILEKKSPFVKFHAMQSTVVFLGIWIGVFVADFVSVVGWLLGSLISLIGFVLWIILMIKAYNKELYKLPIASSIAESLIEKFNNETDTNA